MGFIFPYVQHQFVLASLCFILKWFSVSLIWTQAFALTVQLVLLWGYLIPSENELFHTALILAGLETLHRPGRAYIIISRTVLSSRTSHSPWIATLHARLALSLLFQDWSPHLFTVLWIKEITTLPAFLPREWIQRVPFVERKKLFTKLQITN